MDSILNSVKKVLGILPSYEYYDTDLIIHINSALSILNQYGVGNECGYQISGPENTWDEFMGSDPRLNPVKTFVYMKVRLVFDPPASSSAQSALQDVINELESRIIYTVDHIGEEAHDG